MTYICHMDTMPVGEGWDYPPLEGEIIDGKLYGRGSCDMKAGLAAAMIAFRNLARRGQPLAYDFQLIATVNEEDAMTGAEQAVRDGYVNANSYVLDAEPTDSRIQVAHKGKTWFVLRTQGKTGHASMPEKGCDAIAAMAEIITRIRQNSPSFRRTRRWAPAPPPSARFMGAGTPTLSPMRAPPLWTCG